MFTERELSETGLKAVEKLRFYLVSKAYLVQKLAHHYICGKSFRFAVRAVSRGVLSNCLGMQLTLSIRNVNKSSVHL